MGSFVGYSTWITSCDEGFYRVVESRDQGGECMEEDATLFRLWGTSRNRKGNVARSGFTTAEIETRKLMLLTMPVCSEDADNEEGKGYLILWVTDTRHVHDVGPISAADENAAASSLLYKGGDGKEEQLLSVYEKKTGEGDSYSLVSVRLTGRLQQRKGVVGAWKEVDEGVRKLCPSNAAAPASSGGRCRSSVSIEGLVGYLAGALIGGQWKEE
ncbi:trans-sialidase [Trypanosoma rangeli]|uniref:Trans-sialidase n=1 Tax=Trypanosoma rangeli TaxID=5698 RepID=A0A422MS53_TRYRA|nr:trans-sialidase [Trypanosoma rangeli]RNE96052.1 trans-sialidase [Trypanosoma rangeli]|eukprot:RNE96052.1 trans-sialidase [Trypanosoma rangeli]